MLQYIVYVASKNQIDFIKKSLERIQAKVFTSATIAEGYTIKHDSLGNMTLRLHLLSEIDAITSHLRQNPVDLLIYDERNGGQEAITTIHKLQEDIEDLADLWGPDFHFPLSRMIVILEEGKNASRRAFILGKDQIRDVIVAPKSLHKLLHSIAKILISTHEFREERVACTLSGGGVEGFLFQAGCAFALEKAFTNKSLLDLDVYTGISSGSILASGLASGVPIKEIVASLIGRSKTLPKFSGSLLYDFAYKKISRRILSQSMVWAGLDPYKWSQKFLQSIPTGFFEGKALEHYVKQTIETFGGEDQFSSLNKELYIGATNQDTFEHMVLGQEPFDSIKISAAVRASCALPPVFTPTQIKDHHFIDGQITKTCNLELPVRKGCTLIFIIDPMQPFSMKSPGSVENQGGVFTIIQTIKTLVQSRFKATLKHATTRYPDVDFIVFQPYEECAELMSGLPMKYKFNPKLIELAFRGTLKRLRERHHVYSVKVSKYGFKLLSPRHLLELEKTPLENFFDYESS